MTVLITLTTAGIDSGPFNLYSDASVPPYSAAFEVGVSKTALFAGFPSSNVPNGTTIIRVRSMGVCTNVVDLPIPGITTTTSSSTSSTTTTSTTAVPGGFPFSSGAATSAAACNLPYGPIMYPSGGTVTIGHTVYTDAAKTIPLLGALLWYKAQGYVWLIDNTGLIQQGVFCVV